jgi:thiamine biosynthesis lipoprotein
MTISPHPDGGKRREPTPRWTAVVGPDDVAIWERPGLGTTVRLVVWPPGVVAAAARAVSDEVDGLDRRASRFHDSELVRAERRAPEPVLLSAELAEAVDAALGAARTTGGLLDPTVANALCAIGYDRDFAAIRTGSGLVPHRPRPVPGWRSVRLTGRLLRLPRSVHLDLGATAKGLCADRAAAAAATAARGAIRCGVLVSLGGDIAIAGNPPDQGWPVVVDESPVDVTASGGPVVRLSRGAVATSSVAHRRWVRGDKTMHHIVDPATGLTASGHWRTVTVAAPTCLQANVAATAAIVAGEQGAAWLERTRLPARLVSAAGEVRLLGRWPRLDGHPVGLGGR